MNMRKGIESNDRKQCLRPLPVVGRNCHICELFHIFQLYLFIYASFCVCLCVCRLWPLLLCSSIWPFPTVQPTGVYSIPEWFVLSRTTHAAHTSSVYMISRFLLQIFTLILFKCSLSTYAIFTVFKNNIVAGFNNNNTKRDKCVHIVM